jgi:hypothetical protein
VSLPSVGSLGKTGEPAEPIHFQLFDRLLGVIPGRSSSPILLFGPGEEMRDEDQQRGISRPSATVDTASWWRKAVFRGHPYTPYLSA